MSSEAGFLVLGTAAMSRLTRAFTEGTTASYSESTLIELTAEGGPQAAITVPGFLHGVARIR